MKKLFWAIFGINAIAAIYGFVFFYGRQLSAANPLLAVFIPDCPLASLLFAAAMLVIAFRLRADWFCSLAAATALKYGFWTVFVLLLYPGFYFAPETALMYSALLVAHIGLFIEVLALLPGKFKIRAIHILPVLAWFFANDLSDYLLRTNPPMPEYANAFMFPATVAMSLFFAAFTILALPRIRKPLIEIFG